MVIVLTRGIRGIFFKSLIKMSQHETPKDQIISGILEKLTLLNVSQTLDE